MTAPPVAGVRPAVPDEVAYRIAWRATGVRAGSHRSRVPGSGDDFQGLALLREGADARRLDLRASATDPWGRPWVRQYRQRSRVPVVLVADVSRSMAFDGRADRIGMVARFAQALSLAARRRGDPFGFIACDDAVRLDLSLPPSSDREAGRRVAQCLATAGPAVAGRPGGPGAQGLQQVARWLPRQRSLVFLLSDLHLEPALLARTLLQAAAHDTVVVLLADSAEQKPPARWGLARLADLETGRERVVLLRPGHARRMARHEARRIDEATRLAHSHGAALLVAQDRLDFTAIARHFVARGGT